MSTLTPRQEKTPTPHWNKTLDEARLSGGPKKESGRASGGGVSAAH